MRCSYAKGSIAYLSPRSIGLMQFPAEKVVFGDVAPQEYRDKICETYRWAKPFLDKLCASRSAATAEE